MSPASPRMHEAARGFDRAAPAYERSRPDYPSDAIAFLAEQLDLREGRTVLDLAAGTGKLSRALLPVGVHLTAVEPSEGMRSVFVRMVPGVPVLDGTAEAIPLADGGVDGVVVGQAFHWFRAGPALREIARVLRPGGGVGLIWNRRDESLPWVARLGTIINARDRRGAPISQDEGWRSAFGGDGPFGPLVERGFRFTQRLSPAGVIERALSVSFIAALPDPDQRSIAAEVRSLLDSAPETAGRREIEIPYRADVHISHRVDPASP